MRDMFASAESVLRRADHHITDFKAALHTSKVDQPYSYFLEEDSKTGEHVHKLRFSWDWSDNCSCVLFDAVNNLRACLDQMTYAISIKHRGPRPAGDYVPFPFAKDIEHWPNRLKGLKDKIPAEIPVLFGTFKPYKE
jgi:hypothetical protein